MGKGKEEKVRLFTQSRVDHVEKGERECFLKKNCYCWKEKEGMIRRFNFESAL